jgi:hypothetical protein
MRMTASWFGSLTHRIQGCGATDPRPKAGSPRIVVVWRTAGKARPTELACRRARDRQGQAASRWPAATLDRHCARRPIKARSGRGDDRHLGRTRRWKGLTIKLDNNCPIQGFRMTADRDDGACTGAVVRKPPMKETALGGRVALPRALIYRGLTLAAAVICEHNFCVMARTLLMVENSFCIMCNFKELRVAKIAHISTSALCA